MLERRSGAWGLAFSMALWGCGSAAGGTEFGAEWAALLEDGNETRTRPSSVPEPMPEPATRFCDADCASTALASWSFDDCDVASTQLADQSASSMITHPAFRAVSVACVAARTGLGLRLSSNADVVYAPDQPDFVFDQGLTVAAWIQPSDVQRTQTVLRKRFGRTSSFAVVLRAGQIEFVLRLAGGSSVGVSAPIAGGRFSHFAGTYDGTKLTLYLDGEVVARAAASGAIAPGAGPLLIGNDADGRYFDGIIDQVWLNSLAAPPDAIMGLACGRAAPVASLSPSDAGPIPAGTSASFDLALTDVSGPRCPPEIFSYFALTVPDDLGIDPFFDSVSLAPGETAHVPVHVTPSDLGAVGPTRFEYLVWSDSDFALQTKVGADLTVTPASAPVSTGCAPSPTQPVAPGGYYVNGNSVCTQSGRSHLFHGVDRPSLEWVTTGEGLSLSDFQLMASWGANVVRVALNQDFWLSDSPLYDPSYPPLLDSVVEWAEASGLDVIFDLHWSDAGVLGGCVAPEGSGCQQKMPDQNSLRFWSEMAARYRGDGRVLFELFNEPHQVPWSVWQSGGDTGDGWQAVGMQQLYSAVRSAGADNLVLIGGLDWAYDLSGVPEHRILGYNIVYATHPYGDPSIQSRPPRDWARAWGSLTRTDAVVATEFGSLFDLTCATDYGAQVIRYADAHLAGWTAWAWFPGGCTFPSLIEDWDGTPSPSGAIVRTALLGYDDPAAALRP